MQAMPWALMSANRAGPIPDTRSKSFMELKGRIRVISSARAWSM